MTKPDLFHKVLRATGFFIGDEPAPGLVLRPAKSAGRLRHSLDAFWRDRSNIEVLFKFSPTAPSGSDIAAWHRDAWNLGIAPLLWVVSPQKIELYNTFKRPTSPNEANEHLLRVFKIIDSELKTLDDYAGRLAMASGRFWTNEQRVQSAGRVDQQLLRDLQDVEKALAKDGLARKAAQALLGRTIFLRYLVDRDIVDDVILKTFGSTSLSEILSKRDSAYEIFDWVRATFNGDLFPVETAERRSVKSKHLQLVSQTLSGVNPVTGQGSLWPYKFDVIPIELISSIYEQFAHTATEDESAKDDGLHYTPAPLAGLILDEVMRDLEPNARILDMTCGSGVFLVEALRRLVHLQSKGNPPTRQLIRNAIKKQIFGVDKNAAAIGVASFSLYLTALELDPNPRPPKALRFDPLIGRNLFIADSLRLEEDSKAAALCKMRFDAIVGNPPWTYANADARPEWPEKEKPPLPPRSQDFAFVWKSLALSHEKTRFGIVMRGTPFFSSALSSRRARDALIKQLEPIALVNLAALRDDLFPIADYPAVVLLSRLSGLRQGNTIPVISVPWTSTFSRSGSFEISPSDVRIAPKDQLFDSGHGFKLFALGTPRDRLLVRRMESEAATLSDLLVSLGVKFKTGIQTLLGDGNDSRHLIGMPLLDSGELQLQIDTDDLKKFTLPRIHRPREPSSFQGPLLIAGEGLSHGRAAVGVTKSNLVFTESFYGISFAGENKKHAGLAPCIAGILHSAYASWYLLLTSSEFGVHKRKLLLQDLEALRVPDLKTLRSSMGDAVSEAVRKLDVTDVLTQARSLKKLDEAVFDLFGLSGHERLIVLEGLERAKAEYVTARAVGDQPIPVSAGDAYATAFLDVINAWNRALNRPQYDAEMLNVRQDAALRAVRFVSGGTGQVRSLDVGRDLNDVIVKIGTRMKLPIAARLAASRELRVHADGELIVIKSAARRFWTAAAGLNDADAALGDGLEGTRHDSV